MSAGAGTDAGLGGATGQRRRNLEAIAFLALLLSFGTVSLFTFATRTVACFPGDIGTVKCPLSPGTRSGTVVLLYSNSTSLIFSSSTNNTEVFNLPVNSYSKIIAEAEWDVSTNQATQNWVVFLNLRDGPFPGNKVDVQAPQAIFGTTIVLDLAGTLKAYFVMQSAATIHVDLLFSVVSGIPTVTMHSFAVYGVVA